MLFSLSHVQERADTRVFHVLYVLPLVKFCKISIDFPGWWNSFLWFRFLECQLKRDTPLLIAHSKFAEILDRRFLMRLLLEFFYVQTRPNPTRLRDRIRRLIFWTWSDWVELDWLGRIWFGHLKWELRTHFQNSNDSHRHFGFRRGKGFTYPSTKEHSYFHNNNVTNNSLTNNLYS